MHKGRVYPIHILDTCDASVNEELFEEGMRVGKRKKKSRISQRPNNYRITFVPAESIRKRAIINHRRESHAGDGAVSQLIPSLSPTSRLVSLGYRTSRNGSELYPRPHPSTGASTSECF